MSLTEILADYDIGEIQGEEYHFPRYTHGCWGGRQESLCWMCKIRLPLKFVSMVRRTSKIEDEQE